jgi:hypothetical protein
MVFSSVVLPVLMALSAGVGGVALSQRSRQRRSERPGADRPKRSWLALLLAVAAFIAVLQFVAPQPGSH